MESTLVPLAAIAPWDTIPAPIRTPLSAVMGLAALAIIFWALFKSIKDFAGQKTLEAVRRIVLAGVVALFLASPQTFINLINTLQTLVEGIVSSISELLGGGAQTPGGGSGGTGGSGGGQVP